MSLLEELDISRRIGGGPDPFAPLAPAPVRRRSWFAELVLAPFLHLDERVHYSVAKKNEARADAAAPVRNAAGTANWPGGAPQWMGAPGK